jgi:hypothetical protein
MTDRERAVNRLKRLIKAAHNDSRDFVYVTVGTAGVIVRLLEEQEAVVRCKDCKKRYTVLCIQEEAGNINNQDDWFCADGERR